MKVECITTGCWIQDGQRIFFGLFPWMDKKCKGPKLGDVVTVVNENWQQGIKFYELLEWPETEDNLGWQADQFRPLQENYEQVSFEQIKKEKPISVN